MVHSPALFFCVLFGLGPAGAARAASGTATGAQQVDTLELAALLIRDGHYDRAQAVLARTDLADPALDRARHHLLSGLLGLHAQEPRTALGHLLAASERGSTEPLLPLFLAQAYFGLGDYDAALTELNPAPAEVEALLGAHQLRAQSHWRKGDQAGAFLAFTRGLARFPRDLELLRQRALLLLEMGLYHQAIEDGTRALQAKGARVQDVLTFADALLRVRQLPQAIAWLEEARLRHPAERTVLAQLARAYVLAGLPLAAAGLFRAASAEDLSYVHDAAELYRKGGQLRIALWLNAKVPDPAAKARQRLSLLVDLGRFEEAVAMRPRLARLRLLEDDEIAYAIAYAFFKNGQPEQARQQLRAIRDPRVYERAIELRQAIESCVKRGWACE